MVWGLAATLAWATASSLLGGRFWDHHLVELIVPLALAAGLTAGRRAAPPDVGVLWPRLAAGIVVIVALDHWVGGFTMTLPHRGVAIGEAIAAVARPGDTLVSAVGDAEAVDASRLRSPYPCLWTLPAQVDDPDLSRLTRLMAGPARPTWLVAWERPSFPAPVLRRLGGVVSAHYDSVGVVCGQTIFVRNDVVRQRPPQAESCNGGAVPGY